MTEPRTSFNQLLSPLERRASFARSQTASFCDYSDNVPKWSSDINHHPPALLGNYPPVGGLPDLRSAIVDRERARHGMVLGIENITISNGALHALSLIFRLLNGDVLAQAPLFKTIYDQLTNIPIGVSLFDEWARGVTAIERTLRDHPRAAVIYINVPNNPTGMVLDPDSIDYLVSYSVRHGHHVVIDMVYDDFIYGDLEIRLPSISDNVFIVNSFSKNYGAPNLRLGWVVSSQRSIAALNAAIERDCIAVAGYAQEIGLTLMRHGNADLISAVRHGREIVRRMAAGHPVLKLQAPACGTHFLWEMSGDRDVGEFADYLLRQHRTLVSTSENYVGSRNAYLRLPLGYPPDTVVTAINAIRNGFAEWDKNAGHD